MADALAAKLCRIARSSCLQLQCTSVRNHSLLTRAAPNSPVWEARNFVPQSQMYSVCACSAPARDPLVCTLSSRSSPINVWYILSPGWKGQFCLSERTTYVRQSRMRCHVISSAALFFYPICSYAWLPLAAPCPPKASSTLLASRSKSQNGPTDALNVRTSVAAISLTQMHRTASAIHQQSATCTKLYNRDWAAMQTYVTSLQPSTLRCRETCCGRSCAPHGTHVRHDIFIYDLLNHSR